MSQGIRKDNLRLIQGVGEAAERRLQKAGIYSYASLASQTPDTLGNLLGYSSTKKDVLRGWIQEAKHLKSNPNKKQPESPVYPDRSSRQRYATFTLEILLDDSNHVRRTQVVHVQSGEEKHWSAWDDMDLTNYIIQKAKIKIPSQSKAKKKQPGTNHVTAISLSDAVQVDSLSVTGTRQSQAGIMKPFSVSISEVILTPQESMLHLQCSIECSGDKALEVTAKQSRLVVEVVVYNIFTSQASVLTTCEATLLPDRLQYSMSILLPAPKIGRYLLETIAFIPEADAITIHQGPWLTMIP